MDALLIVLAVLLALLMLLVLSLWLPVTFKFRVEFSPRGLKHEEWVRLSVFPLFLKVPLPKNKRPREQVLKEPEAPAAPPTPEQEEEASAPDAEPQAAPGVSARARSIVDSARAALATFNEVYPKVREALGYAMSGTKVEQFRLRACLGTGDAFEAAMLVGALRSFSGIALSVASRGGVRFGERPRVAVVPVFDRPYVSFDLRGAVSVVPWRGLRAALIVFREVRRVRSSARSVVSNAPGWNTKA